MSNKIVDCKMLVREISNSRCFYIDHGTYHSVLLDTLDISAEREALEAKIAALKAENERYQRIEQAARGLVEYRKRNCINFQLEKADDFIRAMENEL